MRARGSQRDRGMNNERRTMVFGWSAALGLGLLGLSLWSVPQAGAAGLCGLEVFQFDPAIASRPSAVGGQVVEQRVGGQDVAPIGGNVLVPWALPVGLHLRPPMLHRFTLNRVNDFIFRRLSLQHLLARMA